MARGKPLDLVSSRFALGCVPGFRRLLFCTWMVELALRRASRTLIEAKAFRSVARCLNFAVYVWSLPISIAQGEVL
jgi:hypothetical protein